MVIRVVELTKEGTTFEPGMRFKLKEVFLNVNNIVKFAELSLQEVRTMWPGWDFPHPIDDDTRFTKIYHSLGGRAPSVLVVMGPADLIEHKINTGSRQLLQG